jgi:SAM-dependent methyltransferase
MQAECSDIFERLESWYTRDNGQYLLDATRSAVQDRLDRAFGYHILQLGLQGSRPLCEASPINHRLVCAARAGAGVALVGRADELPLESDSVDAVIAHHCLEFSPNPHQALREMQRVLTPQGQLLVIGFNPYSLHGASSYLRGLIRQPLWQQHQPVSEKRLTDWLHLLGCEVQAVRRVYTVPPLGGGKIRAGLVSLDQWSSGLNLPLGGVYLLHATKQVTGLNKPRRLQRGRRGRLVGLVPKSAPTPSSPAAQVSDQFEKRNVAD